MAWILSFLLFEPNRALGGRLTRLSPRSIKTTELVIRGFLRSFENAEAKIFQHENRCDDPVQRHGLHSSAG